MVVRATSTSHLELVLVLIYVKGRVHSRAIVLLEGLDQ